MSNNSQISQSLLQLSDAIEQLALIIAQQNYVDKNQAEEQFKVIVDKFKRSTQDLTASNKNAEPHQEKGFIENWLLQRNIQLGKRTENLYVNQKLYTIADYLADHYFMLKDFYEHLKRAQNIRRDFKVKTTQQSIKYLRKWCNMLHRNKMIDSFYFLDHNTIDVDIAKIHEATYFINGFWLEIFLRKELALLLRNNLSKIKTFDILAQAEIVKPNQKSTEIDLLIMLNQKIYWFECKSGDIGKTYFNRFAEHRKLFQLTDKQSFLVVPQMQLNQAEALMKKSGMQMLYATNLQNQLQQILF